MQAAKVSRNANELLGLVKSCHTEVTSLARKKIQVSPELAGSLRGLTACIVDAGKLFSTYCQQGMLRRLIVDDSERFKSLDSRLRAAMTVSCSCLLKTLITPMLMHHSSRACVVLATMISCCACLSVCTLHACVVPHKLVHMLDNTHAHFVKSACMCVALLCMLP